VNILRDMAPNTYPIAGPMIDIELKIPAKYTTSNSTISVNPLIHKVAEMVT